MKVLFVGLGSIGLRHLNNLYQLGINDFIAFRFRKNTLHRSLPSGVKLVEFSSYQEALKQKPDLVVISNPTSYHLEYTMQAIEAGSHIYIEKPISHNFSDIEKLVNLYNEKQVKIQIGCQLRMHPHLIQIKEWINADKIGEIYSISADVGEYLPGWHPWEDYRDSYAAKNKQGGGVILTLIHEIDYINWLFKDVQLISAIGGNLTKLEMDVEDTAVILMQSNNKIPIQLRMDYWRSPAVRKLNIVGEKGEINWDYHDKSLEFSYRDSTKEITKLDENWDKNLLFIELMDDFLKSIKCNTENISPLEDGVHALRLASDIKKIIQ